MLQLRANCRQSEKRLRMASVSQVQAFDYTTGRRRASWLNSCFEVPSRLASCCRKCSVNSLISLGRSHRGGMCSGMTAMPIACIQGGCSNIFFLPALGSRRQIQPILVFLPDQHFDKKFTVGRPVARPPPYRSRLVTDGFLGGFEVTSG